MFSNHLVFKHDTKIYQYNMMYMKNPRVRLRSHVLSYQRYISIETFLMIYHVLLDSFTVHVYNNKHIFQGCMFYFLNLSSEISFQAKT